MCKESIATEDSFSAHNNISLSVVKKHLFFRSFLVGAVIAFIAPLGIYGIEFATGIGHIIFTLTSAIPATLGDFSLFF